MILERLHPGAAPVEVPVEEAYAGLRLADLAPPGRPHVVANFVASVDGKATLAGRSRGLSSPADRALFHRLRTQADAVLVGTGTLRVERYGAIIRDEALREARVAEGLAPDPLAVTITRGHALPLDIPLFQDPASRIAVYAGAGTAEPDCPAQVLLTCLPAPELSPAAVLRHLRAEHGVRSVLCEGGPTLLNALIADDVLDELLLCLSPQLAGGEHALTIASGPQLAEPRRLVLRTVLRDEDFLFLRYARAPEG